jgi:hypothetical protein
LTKQKEKARATLRTGFLRRAKANRAATVEVQSGHVATNLQVTLWAARVVKWRDSPLILFQCPTAAPFDDPL